MNWTSQLEATKNKKTHEEKQEWVSLGKKFSNLHFFFNILMQVIERIKIRSMNK